MQAGRVPLMHSNNINKINPITIDILDEIPDFTNTKYIPFYTNKSRYLVMYGGAGSGKSHFIAQKILIRILMSMKRGYKERFMILRKTQPAVKKSVYTLMRSYIDKWNMRELVTINKTDLTFTFSNGSEIIFSGLDDPEKLKSIEGITSFWIEEATEIKEADFTQVDLRLRGTTPSYKQIILSFNPVSNNSWIFKHFFEAVVPDSTICHSTYLDNRFIDKEYTSVLEGLKDKDDTHYQIYALGNWGRLENLIFTNWEVRDIATSYGAYDQVLHGLDFGFNHPSAFLTVGLKDDELYIFDEVYERGLTNNELIKQVNIHAIRNHVITADSAEPARIEEFRQAGLLIKPSIKGPGSVKDGIDWVKRRKINIHPKCVNTIKEISAYSYRKDRDGNVFDEPVPFNDDAMAALRYAIEELVTATELDFEGTGTRRMSSQMDNF